MNWNDDMSAAPRDGQFLAFAKGFSGEFYGVAQWANADPDFPRSVSGWFWPYAIRPTHWMHLPPPPHTDKRAEE